MNQIVILALLLVTFVACKLEANVVTTPLPKPTTSATPEKLSESTVAPTMSSTALTLLPPLTNNNGGRIVFVADGLNLTHDIYAMNIDGSEYITLTQDAQVNYTAPIWSPDGEKILYQSARKGVPVFEDIWVMNADGTEQLNLTNDFAYNGPPSWSPDGSKIVFSSERDGNEEIYVINADGSNRIRLTENPAFDYHPRWSPDGEKIAFVSDRNGTSDIYVMSIDGSNIIRLTENINEARFPRWSPDGQQIAFLASSETWPTEAIWVVNADGENQRIISGEINAFTLAWSPNGQYIAFSGRAPSDSHTNVYLAKIGSDELLRFTDDTQEYQNNSWSPDGTKIVVSSGFLDNSELYIFSLDSSEPIRLTDNSRLDCCADWRRSYP